MLCCFGSSACLNCLSEMSRSPATILITPTLLLGVDRRERDRDRESVKERRRETEGQREREGCLPAVCTEGQAVRET